ncbi:unnamed protein product [Paramecium primaurelia]|uniref:Uncharacterized protein n=1 Tax=Paramecium primaurelia TaxID=5886 RepID=A0A8S1PJX9_PARPR|nr:unnamed protein product [Paramecium primaurelia]
MYLIPNFQFLFDIKSNIRIRFVEVHLVQPFLLLYTTNQILQIWDYEKKSCLRAINVSLIEPDRVQEVKQLKFHDNQIIYRLFNDQSLYLQNSIMILTSDKLYSYKYCSDYSDLITNGPIGVSNKCLEFIDSQYIAVGGEGVKIIDLKQNLIVKTMKGYHQKGINQMLSYKQNQFDRPRLVASSLDGTMACWNADTANEQPTFKFLMSKKGKQLMTANNGQEILSIAYDPYDFQIVTVTENYITLWSSLNGMEINRFKPPIPIKELVHISHSNFPSQTYIGHTRSSEIYALYLIGKQQKKFDYVILLDLKNVVDVDKQIKINTITTNRLKSNLLCVATTHGLFLLQASELLQKYCFHHTFVCSLTLNQSKTFVDDTGLLKKLTNISQEQLKQYELLNKQTDQSNLMYLSTSGKNVICTLIEFTQELTNKKEEWTVMSRQHKIFTFQTTYTWDDSKILISLSGRYFVIHNNNGQYAVLSINNKNLNYDMMESDLKLTLHFLSELEQLSTGIGNSIAWHQYKEELIISVPLNERNQNITIEEKIESQTSGFFNQKTFSRNIYNYSSNIVNFVIQIYGFDHTKKQAMFLKATINNLPQPEKVFGVQSYYFIVTNSECSIEDQKLKAEIKQLKMKHGQFYQFQNNQLIPFGNQFISPLNVTSNINETFLLFQYEKTFSLLMKQNGQFIPILTEFEQITDSYFWEDLLFYVTQTQIKMVIVVNQVAITITLAQLDPPQNQLQSCEFLKANQLDGQYPEIQVRPNGQLKILMIHDSKLIVINQAQEISFIHLKHALLEFCINLQVDDFSKCVDNASKLDQKMQKLIAQMFIAKNAIDQVQYLNMDLHERLTLELDHNLNETQLTLDLIDQVMLTVADNKEKYIKDLAIKLSQQKREEELDLVIQYGLQNQLFPLYDIIPLLSETQREYYLESQGIFQNFQSLKEISKDKEDLMLYNLYNIFQL